MKAAIITDGIVGVPRPTAEAESGAVQIPDYVKGGDTFADGKYFRDGVELVDPGHDIPVSGLFTDLTDGELNTLLVAAFPNANATQRGIIGFLFRAAGQTSIHSDNKRLPAAKALFTSLLGAERMNELFRAR